MSVLLEEPIETEATLEDDEDVHLSRTEDPIWRSLCGAPMDNHNCPSLAWHPSITHCPNCKRPVCSYCALLAMGYFSRREIIPDPERGK